MRFFEKSGGLGRYPWVRITPPLNLMKLTPTTILAALVLIGAGGFMAGRISSPASSAIRSDGPIEARSTRSSSRDSPAGIAGLKNSPRTSRPASDEKSLGKGRLTRLESIIRGENPLERNRALLALIDQLGPGEFEDAVNRFRSLGITGERTAEYYLLMAAWAQADPLTALAYAKENSRGGGATATVLTTWATTDPEAAIRWAQSNHQGDGANPYLPGIIRGLATTDPARATELLAGMPKSVERGQALDSILPHLVQQGPEATRAWIAAITDDSLRDGAILRVAEQLADKDPAGTASWLVANPGEASQRRLDNVYSVWAQKDQQAAMSSFSTLPAGDARSNALRGVISSVAGDNPKAAISLMDRYPKDVNDRVVQNFVWHSFGSDPEVAVTAIARIGDEKQREQMYRRTLEVWKEQDPASAKAWVLGNPGSSGALTPR